MSKHGEAKALLSLCFAEILYCRRVSFESGPSYCPHANKRPRNPDFSTVISLPPPRHASTPRLEFLLSAAPLAVSSSRAVGTYENPKRKQPTERTRKPCDGVKKSENCKKLERKTAILVQFDSHWWWEIFWKHSFIDSEVFDIDGFDESREQTAMFEQERIFYSPSLVSTLMPFIQFRNSE